MPKDVDYGDQKPETEAQKQAKGKNGTSLANDLFASIENFFYEFGLISKPSSQNRNEDAGGNEKQYQQKQSEPEEYDSPDYSDDEVLLSQYNKIGQQYWQGTLTGQESDQGEAGYSDSHLEV